MLTKKEARLYAYDLILEGKNSIDKLYKDEKEILSALIIESNYKSQAWEYVSEADIHLELPYLLSRYMKNKCEFTATELLDFMVNNAVRYASNEIVDLLIEQENEKQYKDI